MCFSTCNNCLPAVATNTTDAAAGTADAAHATGASCAARTCATNRCAHCARRGTRVAAKRHHCCCCPGSAAAALSLILRVLLAVPADCIVLRVHVA